MTHSEALSPALVEDFISDSFGKLPSSFTEIIINEVKSEDLDTICSSSFIEELQKILPLRIANKEPFFDQIKSGDKLKLIKNIFKDPTFCKTIDVFFGIQGERPTAKEEEDDDIRQTRQYDIEQLFKYFPKFKNDLEFIDKNIIVHNSRNNDFAYYVLHTLAEDLHRGEDCDKENGFWVRNQNFLVKRADFLEKPGPGKRIIDQPLRNWVFGEVFHKNMNNFLSVSREDYLFSTKEFNDFRDELFEIVRPLNKQLRKIWQKKNIIDEKLIKPFSRIDEPDGALKNTEKRLLEMMRFNHNDEKISQGEFENNIFKILESKRSKEIEDDNKSISTLITNIKGTFILGNDDDEDIQVILDPKLKDRVETYKLGWDVKKDRLMVQISPSLFKDRDVVFLNNAFKLIFVASTEDAVGVSINTKQKRIYVNPFNKTLSRYDISILDVYVALEVADKISTTKEELKSNVLNLLGLKISEASQYIVNLGDELRRAVE